MPKINEAEDEIRLTHDDNKVLLDYFFFSQGQVIVFEDQFNKNWPFDEKTRISLWEKDEKSRDDFIGEHIVFEDGTTRLNKTGRLPPEGSDYNGIYIITYDVVLSDD